MLPLILGAFAFFSFVFSSVAATNTSPSEGALMTARIVNVVLGFLGIVSILMIPIGLIVGIIILVKNQPGSQGVLPPQEPPQPPVDPTQQTPR